MGASGMDCLITILEQRKTPDGQGGYSNDFVPFIDCPVWAKFLAPRIREAQTLGAVPVIITQGVEIRYLDGVKKGFKVRHENSEYDVLHVEGSKHSGKMILTCKELDFC